MMSFLADSADYSSSDTDFDAEEEDLESTYGLSNRIADEDDSPTVEESPVPMSKNAGNRFVAFIFDRALNLQTGKSIDPMEMHEHRISLTEQHVLFCRKANLYNETFNSESVADVLWSYQLLSSDLKRTVGHAMCIESTSLKNAKELLSRDPIVLSMTGGDTTNIPFCRWRHIRDHTLRQDDGRFGLPTLCVAFDRSDGQNEVKKIREEMKNSHLEYLIRSERVIAAGPLHVATVSKDDPSSHAIGDLILFNAPNRDDAVNFVENNPSALAGLYESMRIHRFNALDVTGKFVATNLVYPDNDKRITEMREAMELWGYPVDDRQTKWINW